MLDAQSSLFGQIAAPLVTAQLSFRTVPDAQPVSFNLTGTPLVPAQFPRFRTVPDAYASAHHLVAAPLVPAPFPRLRTVPDVHASVHHLVAAPLVAAIQLGVLGTMPDAHASLSCPTGAVEDRARPLHATGLFLLRGQ